VPPETPGADPRPDRPEYRVYRSRPRLADRLRRPGQTPMDLLRRRRRGAVPPGAPGARRSLRRRILKWGAIAIGSWILLSIVIFMVSAQTAPGIPSSADNALSGGGNLVTGSTILVLGSDQRPPGTHEPGAATTGPSRSDSILLLHVGFGTVRKLSILRDTQANVPGFGIRRINAAYALGGPALAIKTVEQFLGNGIQINHLVLVSFTNFPKLIDALGGIDITLKRCVSSNRFGGKRIALRAGDHHLTGREALRFARVRKNRCAPNEDDRARAARQQQVLAAMRDRIASPTSWPSTFIRLPLISWEAPRALRTDMHGPGLTALFTDLLTGGSGATEVLKPTGFGPGGSLIVPTSERARAVRQLLGK